MALPTGDPRRLALLTQASTLFAQGDHSSALAMLRAAASLGPSPLDSAPVRDALARLALPVVASPTTASYERSADGSTVAFINTPEALGATSNLATLCDDMPLEWANLLDGTRGALRLAAVNDGSPLAPVLALDADAMARDTLVHVTRLFDDCRADEELCGSEPQPPAQVEYEGGYAAGGLVPRHELCGRVEGLSPHGRFAIIAVPDVQRGRMGVGRCTSWSRLAWVDDPQHMVCVGTRYQVVSLVDQRVALDAAPGAEAVRVSEDERYAYVRGSGTVTLAPLEAGLAGAALATDCRGAVAFTPNGETFVALCGERLDILSLGATVTTRSVPVDQRGLGRLRGEFIAAVAASDELAQFALVFLPEPQARVPRHRWAVLDARGRVTDREEEAAPTARRTATSVSPVNEEPGRAPPVLRHGGWGICGGLEAPYHGQTLAAAPGVGARFSNRDLVLWGRPREIPTEYWARRHTVALGSRPGSTRMTEMWLANAGELLFVEPSSPERQEAFVFARGTYGMGGETLGEPRADHRLGPSRWDVPEDEGIRDPVELAPFLTSTGARTNLRVCPDDLRVVAVLPQPDPDSVWADAASCSRPPAPPESEWQCSWGTL